MLTAALNLAAGAIATVVAWQLLTEVDETGEETIDVTLTALDSLEETVDVADGVIEATVDGLLELERGLLLTSEVVLTSDDVLRSVADLTAVAAPALADTTATLRRLESTGNVIDGVLDDLSRLPLAPSYDADDGLGSVLAELADDLDPLAGALEQTSVDLERFVEGIDGADESVRGISDGVAGVTDQLESRAELVEGYRASIADARELALDARGGVGGDVGVLRLLVLIAGAGFSLSQLLLLWFGREQVRTAEGPDEQG